MILKASQRGGASQLAAHLQNTRDNEHVEVHELRGFSADDLRGAFQEIDAASRGTRAKQFLFSLSLSPPPNERVAVQTFESAIDAVERKLGLEGQPRAIIFHEKEGRRHAHAVWSRIDTERMKAINLPHFKLKLQDVARQLYREHGWTMPRGLANDNARDPLNFTRAEWEQAKKAKQDPKALKAMFKECWDKTDSGKAYAGALAERGYTLAQGDRRAVVAVDFRGQVYAVAKWTGLRTKETRGKLDQLKDLPTVDQAKSAMAARMTQALRGHVAEAEAAREKQAAALAKERAHLVERQRKERADQSAAHEQRWAQETAQRASRLNKGMRGLWDRITGQHGKQTRENEHEALAALRRDRREKDSLIERHLNEREVFHTLAKQQKKLHEQDMEQLHRDIAGVMQSEQGAAPSLRENFQEAARLQERVQEPWQVERPVQQERGPGRGR